MKHSRMGESFDILDLPNAPTATTLLMRPADDATKAYSGLNYMMNR